MSNSQRVNIVPDEPGDTGALGFSNYSRRLADTIINSAPRFSIGIFGDWGSGKTTLLKMIEKELRNEKKILTVWFDAWRYEREENLAIIPFLRTISIKLENTDHEKDI